MVDQGDAELDVILRIPLPTSVATVAQATGVIIARFGVSAEAAFDLLTRVAEAGAVALDRAAADLVGLGRRETTLASVAALVSVPPFTGRGVPAPRHP